jgi:hypothetical protein
MGSWKDRQTDQEESNGHAPSRADEESVEETGLPAPSFHLQVHFPANEVPMRIIWQQAPGTVRHWLRLVAPVRASVAEESVVVVFLALAGT